MWGKNVWERQQDVLKEALKCLLFAPGKAASGTPGPCTARTKMLVFTNTAAGRNYAYPLSFRPVRSPRR